MIGGGTREFAVLVNGFEESQMKMYPRFFLAALICLSVSLAHLSQASAESNYLAPTATGVTKGDFNFDYQVNEDDADAFQIALVSASAYETQFGVSPLFKGDIDGNGIVDLDDIPGYLRLLNPTSPAGPLELINSSTLVERSLSSTPTLGLLRMSTDGRYAISEGGHTYEAGLIDSVTVHDTFSKTDIRIGVPPGTDFDGFYHESLAISGNGLYVALTGVKVLRDENGRVSEFISTVFRYNLETGAVDFLPPVEGRDIWFSFHPSLSNDGNTLLYRGFTTLGNGEREAGAYVTRFRKGARGNETQLVTLVDPITFSTAATLAPRVSGDGKFALIPYTKAEHVEWIDQETNRFSLVHHGLSLYELTNNTLVKQLADGAQIYDYDTRQRLPSSFVEQEVYGISRNGNIIAFCKVDQTIGSSGRSEKTTTINLFNRKMDRLTLIETTGHTSCPQSLTMSSDGAYLSYANKIYDVRTRKFTSVEVPEGIERLHSYFGVGEFSGDGCYIGLNARGPSTNDEYASIISPNPLKNCQPVSLSGDVNGDGCVTGADYMLWQRSVGTSVTPGEGADTNADGSIDADDLALINENYGSCLP